MKTASVLAIGAAVLITSSAASAAPVQQTDISRYLYGHDRNKSLFSDDRSNAIERCNAVLEAGKSDRFAHNLTSVAPDGSYTPDLVFKNKDLYGDIDGPDGELWYYQGTIEYEYVVHNEYWTEELPKSFSVDIYNSDMELMGTIKDTFVLKENEARVRQADVLPIITQKYFNDDDKYEVAVTVIINPKPYGVVPYTYVYALGDAPGEDGDNTPLTVINGMVSDVLHTDDGGRENVIMTFMHEYNDSGLTDDDIYDYYDPDNAEKRENYWKYQMGNKINLKALAAADADGNYPVVFEKTIVYYQSQGNQQDDALSISFVQDGKHYIVFPYYEGTIYNPFYGPMDEPTQRLPNNLIIEVYKQPATGQPFELEQTTKINVELASEEYLTSYYSIGAFRYKEDIVQNNGKFDFIVTRRDLAGNGDSE